MANLCAKLKQREKNKYRKIVSTDEPVYSIEDITINTSTPYVPGAALEEGEWFSVQNASSQEYKIDLLTTEHCTVDFNSMNRSEFGSVDFVFTEIGNLLCFQNVYNKTTDVLYFKRLESITSIFRGIDQLYKEATEEETTQFLANDFIQLKQDYNASKVKTANRKRIALAQKTLESLDADSRRNIFTYIGEYCPELKVSETSFEVGDEEELKMLLYGIEQRFYTTIVGGEKRIANSVVPFGQ